MITNQTFVNVVDGFQGSRSRIQKITIYRKGKPKTEVAVPIDRSDPEPVGRTYEHRCIVPGTTTEKPIFFA